jgi:transcriptional regulator with XRE-family HTH domain
MLTFDQRIGKKLQEVREKKGLSLRDVAERYHKSYTTIYAYETGRNGINVSVLKDLCDIYGVNYLDLLNQVYYEEKLGR